MRSNVHNVLSAGNLNCLIEAPTLPEIWRCEHSKEGLGAISIKHNYTVKN